MECFVQKVNGVDILFCSKCKSPLVSGSQRVLFCSKCKLSEGNETHERILCCVECEKPLKVTQIKGSYCTICNFAPSAQDTFLQKMS